MKKLKVTEMNRLELAGYHSSAKLPIVVVLDNVRSMNNVGSIFRTCDAFRLQSLYLCGITAHPPHPDIHKTALGAEESVQWYGSESTLTVVEDLKAQGYQVYALEQAHGSISLEALQTQAEGGGYALVVGNEVHGVAQEVVDACHGCVEIPQFGTKHSLNVSVATGIALWQMVRPLLGMLSL